jgi:hypothetical protein
MSWIPIDKNDYARERPKERKKNQKVYSTKVKLPTNMRSKKVKCSLCKEPSIQVIQISDIETRRLCREHLADWKRKDNSHSVLFVKASKL